MILMFDNGDQVRGDAIIKAALRTDLTPIPVTFEATLRADESVLAQTKEGMVLTTGQGDRLKIISRKPITGGQVQGDRLQAAVELVAYLEACTPASYVLERPIVMENQPLHTLYRACGCTMRPMAQDVSVPRFVCMKGQTPTFMLARAVQEAGGAVRWKNGRLEFLRLADMLKAAPSMSIPSSATKGAESDFLERHEVPTFYSIADDGSIIYADSAKARSSSYSPRKSKMMLNGMGKVLVRRKEARIDFAGHLCAGDVIEVAGAKNLAIITACHYFASGTETGGAQQAFTKLWLGDVV